MALSVRYERDGLVLPRAIGGSVALDLVNTLAGWDRPSEHQRTTTSSRTTISCSGRQAWAW